MSPDPLALVLNIRVIYRWRLNREVFPRRVVRVLTVILRRSQFRGTIAEFPAIYGLSVRERARLVCAT